MKTKTVLLYDFDELPTEKAKEKARDWYRGVMEGDNYFSEPVIEDAKTILALMGFDIKQVYWSGFSSQGDGACFEGEWNATKYQKGKASAYAPTDMRIKQMDDTLAKLVSECPSLGMRVKHQGHYYHKYSTAFEVFDVVDDFGTPEPTEKQTEEIKELSRDAMEWIYRSLESAYEYETSDAQIDETILANGYTFTVDGKRES